MRYLGVLLAASLSATAFAHDEGHGPKLTDAPQMGGIVSPLSAMEVTKEGSRRVKVYQAELTRSEDGTVRVYVYDRYMQALNMSHFEKEAQAVLKASKKEKVTKKPFALKLEGDAFVGKAPKAPSRPFSIEVTVKSGSKELSAAFENLD